MANIIDNTFPVSIEVAGPFLTDGFEEGPAYNFAKWDGIDLSIANNYVEYSTLHPHHGTYSYRSMVYAYNQENNGWCEIYKTISPMNPVYVRFYMLIDQLSTLGNDIRFVDVAQGTMGRYGLAYWCMNNNAGQARWKVLVRNNGIVETYYGPNCNINQMYCVEIGFYYGAAANGWLKTWVNGTQIFNITGITCDRTLNIVGLGHMFSTVGPIDTSIYYDCVVINDSPIGCEI